jgi:hypothetical protein
VIGAYEDSGQVYADFVDAETAFEAMILVSQATESIDLMIIGAIEGSHQMVAACEDSNSVAYATDLRNGE